MKKERGEPLSLVKYTIDYPYYSTTNQEMQGLFITFSAFFRRKADKSSLNPATKAEKLISDPDIPDISCTLPRCWRYRYTSPGDRLHQTASRRACNSTCRWHFQKNCCFYNPSNNTVPCLHLPLLKDFSASRLSNVLPASGCCSFVGCKFFFSNTFQAWDCQKICTAAQ